MKGIIFTEFFDMVEQTFSLEVLDKIINEANLPNDGAYTAVGTYDHGELIKLVTALSKITQISIPDLENAYGKFLFKKLVLHYPMFIRNTSGSFEFLHTIDGHIHVEVRKLYPDAELPKFICHMINPQCMTIDYYSSRPFADLAQGLMEGCFAHFGENISLQRQILKDNGN